MESKTPKKSVLGRGLASLLNAQPVPVTLGNSKTSQTMDRDFSKIINMKLKQEGIAKTPLVSSSETNSGSPVIGVKDGEIGEGVNTLRTSEIAPQTTASHRPSEFELKTSLDADVTETPSPEVHLSSRGLSVTDSESPEVAYLPIDLLINNPNQPRKEFKEQEIRELADSIKAVGVLQPILVRPSHTTVGYYEIVAGERRWRASKYAEIQSVPVIIRELSERETLEISIIENVQREALNPVEEAIAYKRLSDEFNLTQDEVAVKVGKDRSTVTNLLRVLKLPKEILEYLSQGKITLGHAKALLSLKESPAQLSIAKKIISDGVSVRELESLVARAVVLDAGKTAPSDRRAERGIARESSPLYLLELQDKLRRSLGTKVKITCNHIGRGKIEIQYFSPVELERLVDALAEVTLQNEDAA